MSILSDVKFLLKKYIKNPILIAAGAYILWKFIQTQKKKEGLIESVKIIDEKGNKSLIFDSNTNKYVLIVGSRVFSSDKEEDLRKMMR